VDKKYLLSNGDSWTLGFMLDTEYMRLKTMFKMKMNYEHLSKLIEDDDLDEWSWYIENTKLQKESYDFSVKNRFTGLASKKIGLEEINISWPGKSNRAIMRTTIEWILDNQDKVKDTFFLIGWTAPHRTESVSEDKDEYEIGGDSNIPFSVFDQILPFQPKIVQYKPPKVTLLVALNVVQSIVLPRRQ